MPEAAVDEDDLFEAGETPYPLFFSCFFYAEKILDVFLSLCDNTQKSSYKGE